jgi:hypothetical protein
MQNELELDLCVRHFNELLQITCQEDIELDGLGSCFLQLSMQANEGVCLQIFTICT